MEMSDVISRFPSVDRDGVPKISAFFAVIGINGAFSHDLERRDARPRCQSILCSTTPCTKRQRAPIVKRLARKDSGSFGLAGKQHLITINRRATRRSGARGLLIALESLLDGHVKENS